MDRLRARRGKGGLRAPGGWQAALVCLLLAAPGLAQDSGFEARVNRALSARALEGAKISALVIDGGGGGVLFARSPDRALIPASNQKVLTSLAALHTLGPTHRFVTEVSADREIDADGAVGHLYIRGGGDPALTSEQCWRLAADLRARGLRRVEGDLVLDDGRFDRVRWHPAWGAVSSRAYHAPVSGLEANYGSFAVWVVAGEAPGEPVQVRIDPPLDYFEVANRAKTGSRRSALRLQVEREPTLTGERVLVSGSLPAGAKPQTVLRSVADPTRHAGAVLRAALDALEIGVGGEVREAAVPASAVSVHRFHGLALAEVLRRFMKWSNNVAGETLVKNLAVEAGSAPGSWPRGMAAVADSLRTLGLDLDGANLVDGSGLSYDNAVTPRLLVDAIRIGRTRFGVAPEWIGSFPIAGRDGTLRKRAEGAEARVRAKTGLLTRVTGLSGIAAVEGGGTRVFSILVNDFRGSASGAMDAVDRFAEALTRP